MAALVKEPVIIPDPFFEYNIGEDVPLIIDNGAYHVRAGFANEEKPKLIFRNLMVKLRGKKESELLVGNDITDLEAMKWSLRSPFEVNVVTQFDTQESVFDYIFSHLGINTSSVNHPIVINEPPAVPIVSRSNINEMLFECYGVPSVLTGIDALFSHYYQQKGIADCCVISIGHHSSHILPIVGGCLSISNASRINLGGFNLSLYLQRILQLKYPLVSQKFTFIKCEQIVQRYAKFASDYRQQVLEWSCDNYYNQNGIDIKLESEEVAGKEGESETKRLKKPNGLSTIKLGSELLRVPELLFSPQALIAFDQCGVSEALSNVIKKMDDHKYFENIFVTGGTTKIGGLKGRIEADVRSILPFGFNLKVTCAEDASLDSWNGAKKASNNFRHNFVTKSEYHEIGSHYIKEYELSNRS